jgi:hypothetical protein
MLRRRYTHVKRRIFGGGSMAFVKPGGGATPAVL